MDKLKIIIDSYNEVLKSTYEGCFNGKEELKGNWEEEFEAELTKSIGEWEDTPIRDIENLSPSDFFKQVDSYELITEYFIKASQMSDEGLPPSLTKYLLSFEEKAVSFLIKLIADNYKHNEDNHSVILAIR